MSPDQANELKLILLECDLEYVKWFNAKLMKNYNTQDFCQISAENFEQHETVGYKKYAGKFF